jgi:phenylalanyl-tRNA synthetase alpha chain
MRGERAFVIDLREHEARTLQALASLGKASKYEEIAARTGMDEAAVMRAALTLAENGYASVKDETAILAILTPEGRAYASDGLPERRIVKTVVEHGGRTEASQAARLANVPAEMLPIVYGWLKKKRWARLETVDDKTVIVAENVPPTSRDEELLRSLSESPETDVSKLSAADSAQLRTLKQRKLVTLHDRVNRLISISGEGLKLAEKGITVRPEVSVLTPEMLATGGWRQVRLRKYDVRAEVAPSWPGKKQAYRRFLDELKWKLVALGFKEMTGPIIETMFFNCDALYMPQDHPAREVHDIYLVKSPEYADPSPFARYLKNVKRTHVNGWRTGSTGWRCPYSEAEASRLILRSHGTAQSARTLVSRDLEIPGKYFSIARCFRPDKVDKTHLTEFNQVEGIVVGEDLTLRDLLGVLERFAIDLAGADKVRFNPDYFPFTEPSVELVAYKEGAGWFEFGGSGIFRPELTIPLGVKVPVIAWGLGVERLFMMKAAIDDMRTLFSQDLDWLRKQELI